jgi:hypothetical protein
LPLGQAGRCDGGADDITSAVQAKAGADCIAVQYTEIHHDSLSGPQERMKDLVAGQIRRTGYLASIVD